MFSDDFAEVGRGTYLAYFPPYPGKREFWGVGMQGWIDGGNVAPLKPRPLSVTQLSFGRVSVNGDELSLSIKQRSKFSEKLSDADN